MLLLHQVILLSIAIVMEARKTRLKMKEIDETFARRLRRRRRKFVAWLASSHRRHDAEKGYRCSVPDCSHRSWDHNWSWNLAEGKKAWGCILERDGTTVFKPAMETKFPNVQGHFWIHCHGTAAIATKADNKIRTSNSLQEKTCSSDMVACNPNRVS